MTTDAQSTGSSAREPDRTTLAAVCLFTLIAAAVFALGFERPAYRDMLAVESAAWSGWDRTLFVWTIWAKTSALLLPAVPIAAVALRLRGAWAAAIAAGLWVWLMLVWLLADLRVYGSFGRHVLDLFRFVGADRAMEMGGGAGRWVGPIITLMAAVAVAVVAGQVAVGWSLRRRPTVAHVLGHRWVRTPAAAVWGAAVAVPLAVWQYADQPLAIERLYGAMPIDLRIVRDQQAPLTGGDPVLNALDADARRLYANYFALINRAQPIDADARLDPPADPPSVVLIVMESWRHDALDYMPRLRAWTQNGLRLDRHYAASHHSERGLFAIMYGRIPLAFDATLDARVPPQLTALFRASGYHASYATGSPHVWVRFEDFMNDRAFDRIMRDDRGDWPDWDRNALSNVRTILADSRSPGGKPQLAVAFLISSHFEYKYPPKYAVHQPDEMEIASVWQDNLGPELRPSLWNRYRNALAYLDDLVADAIDSFDPARTIVVLTGDHGESFYEDKRYGHGWSFSEPQVRVPAVIVGPGVPVRTIHTATTHADLLPTLAHAVAGRPVAIARCHGRDLLNESATPADEAVLAYSKTINSDASMLLIRGEDRLMLTMDLAKPRMAVRGFETPYAALKSNHGIPLDAVPAWSAFLDNTLARIAR